ncbi:MAG: hypothetical protein GXC72_09480 [Chitinophagaceae bacterium]|nr:hypothetical protein [Chitinophagaceae bacterium]
MDLDALKQELNQRLATDHAVRSGSDLGALLKGKTSSLLGKLKRSLLIEIGCCIFFILLMTYICVATNHWSLRLYFGTFTVLMFAFGILLYYLYRRTLLLDQQATSIKKNLQDYVNLLQEFVKRYFQFTMALIPICITFSIVLSNADPIHIPEAEKLAVKLFTAKWQLHVFLVVYMLALAISVYYFTKWYLRKLYGKYLDELKKCIAELED